MRRHQSWPTQCMWLLLTCLNSGLMAGSAAAMLEYNGKTIMSKNCVQGKDINIQGYARDTLQAMLSFMKNKNGENRKMQAAAPLLAALTPGWLLVMPSLSLSMSGDTG